jgi:magnesium-transporting ATPase (P-type)
MLTGDRQDTALNIAIASGFTYKTSTILIVSEDNFLEFFEKELTNNTVNAIESPIFQRLAVDPYISAKFFTQAEKCN